MDEFSKQVRFVCKNNINEEERKQFEKQTEKSKKDKGRIR